MCTWFVQGDVLTGLRPQGFLLIIVFFAQDLSQAQESQHEEGEKSRL
jgi:hypothetical protein